MLVLLRHGTECTRARTLIGSGDGQIVVTVVGIDARSGRVTIRVDGPPGTAVRRGEDCCQLCVGRHLLGEPVRLGKLCARHNGEGRG